MSLGGFLGAVSGADALEIVVAMRDLSGAGFKKLEQNISTAQRKANTANLSGFSKASGKLEQDAEKAAGKTGGGGVGALISAFTGLPGPLAIAGVAIGGFAALSAATVPVSEKVKQQENQLAQAFKDHGESLDKLRPQLDAAIKTGENYAFTADDTRGAIIKLTEAGLNMQQVQEALPHVMDLARAKQLDLSTATDAYTSSVFGNARALKQYGVILPPVLTSSADVAAKTDAVKKAQENLKSATEHLGVVEDGLRGKHHLTAAEAAKLHDAEQKVKDAQVKLKDAQDKLSLAQQGGIDKGQRLKLINDKLQGAIGNQKGTMTDLQVAQAKLNDAWERFATTVGPAIEGALTDLVGLLSGFIDVLSKIGGAIGDIVHNVTGAGGKSTSILGIHKAGNAGGIVSGAGKKASTAAIQAGGGTATGMFSGVGSSGSAGGIFAHAEGGMVGLHGPEFILVGEKGPEYVVPNHDLGRGGGSVTINVGFVVPPTRSQIEDLAHQLDLVLGRRLSMAGSSQRLMGAR